MYLVNTPFFLKWYYPKLLWNNPRQEKVIYLTFDDGPIPIVTPFVLKTLAAYHAKATFFCIGDNIVKNPAVYAQVVEGGHSIGNHTFNHLNGWKTDDETYVANMLKAQALTQTNLFRPPYGRIKKSQIRKLVASYELSAMGTKRPNTEPITHNPQLKIVMWDVLSGDFDLNLSPQKCFKNVTENTKNGSIIVFHDSLKAFDRLEYVLPRVMEYFTKKGFSFSTL